MVFPDPGPPVIIAKDEFIVENGLRIAQMVVCPIVQGKLVVVKDLPETARGSGGFGSTGAN